MKKQLKYNLFYLTIFISCFSFSQNPDSLKIALKNAKHDTTKLFILIQLSQLTDGKEILVYAKPAVVLADKLLKDRSYNNSERKNKTLLKYKATALGNIGFAQRNNGDFNTAADYYQQSLKIMQIVGDTVEIANIFNNLGVLYHEHGNVRLALANLDQCLKLMETINDTAGIAEAYNTIADVYNGQQDYKKALEYCNIALVMQQQIGNQMEIARAHNNLGAIYAQLENNTAALKHYDQSLQILEKNNYKEGIGYILSNIGSIHQNNYDLKNALIYYHKSLQLQKELDNQPAVASNLFNIGCVYYFASKKDVVPANKRKDLALARNYFDSSLILSKQFNFIKSIRDVEQKIAKTDSMAGNLKGAFEHYKQYIIYRDSISNDGTRKASIKSQLNYEFDKKEAVIKEQQEKERVIAEEKNRFQKIIIAAVIAGLLIVLCFAAFIFRSLKTTRHQKLIIEEKQKEILDSIHYAKRIQTSLLPPEKYLEKIFKERFKN